MSEQARVYIRVEDAPLGTDPDILDAITIAEEVVKLYSKANQLFVRLIGDNPDNLKGRVNVLTLGPVKSMTLGQMGFMLLSLRQLAGFAREIANFAETAAAVVNYPMALKIELEQLDNFSTNLATFSPSFDVSPRLPSYGTTEYLEMLQAIEATRPELIRTEVNWQQMKSWFAELAEQGQPLPPHCSSFIRSSIKVRSKR